MKAAVVIPTATAGDEWRARALAWTLEEYAQALPDVPVVLGELGADEEWSKGAAVAAGVAEVPGAEVLVLADADSYLTDRKILPAAIAAIVNGSTSWIVPHKMVYRLRQAETERLYSDETRRARWRSVHRTPYIGPAGGGITVISREAFDAVQGIDRRFLGWGGEDLAFGWALETLVGPHLRMSGRLVHLWHPHPAPDLRGSAESEALIDRYKTARGFPRRMAALVSGEDWVPLEPLAEPVRFRMTANRRTLRLFGSDRILTFRDGTFETTDPELVEALRTYDILWEESRR